MATLLRLTRIDGTEVQVDSELITNVSSTPNADALTQGVSRGTRITKTGTPTQIDVVESRQEVETAIAAARKVLSSSSANITQTTALANVPAPTGPSVTIVTPGTYKVEAWGLLGTSVAATGGVQIQLFVNGTGVGEIQDIAATGFVANSKPEIPVGVSRYAAFVAGDVITYGVGKTGTGNALVFQPRLLATQVNA